MRLVHILPCLATLLCGTLGAAELVPGLVGDYYARPEGVEDFPVIPAGTTPTLRRADRTINVDATDDAWPRTQLTENFYIVWNGILRVPKTATYTLFTESDDGSRLFIDGRQVVDNGGSHPMEEKSGEIELTAGDHPLKVEFFQGGGGKGCKVSWAAAGVEKGIIPGSALFHSADLLPAPVLPADSDCKAGLKAEIFQLGEDAGDQVPKLAADAKPGVARIDATIDVSCGEDAWPGTTMTDNIYIRWDGVVRVPKDGAYTFTLESDDGSWLDIDGERVIGNGGSHPMQEASGVVELKAGNHLLHLDYREGGGEAGCRLMWTAPGGTKEIIPASALFHLAK